MRRGDITCTEATHEGWQLELLPVLGSSKDQGCGEELPVDMAGPAKGNFPMWKLVPSKIERTLSGQIMRIYLWAKN